MDQQTSETSAPGIDPAESIQRDLAELAAEAGAEYDPATGGATAAAIGAASAAPDPNAEGEREYRDAVALVLAPAFEILAPAWKVTSREVDQLAGAYAAVLQKYYPGGMAMLGPEFAAVAVTVMVIAPRINTARQSDQGDAKPEPEPVKTEDTPVDGAALAELAAQE